MKIDLQTKIGALLDAYPALEEKLLEISPAFSKLRNPVLRRTIAQITTVQQAAKMGGIAPSDLVRILRQAVGLTDTEVGADSDVGSTAGIGASSAKDGKGSAAVKNTVAGVASSSVAGRGGESSPGGEDSQEKRPDWFDPAKIAIRFDVGRVIDAGESPMSDILRLSGGLAAGKIMEFSVPFRPEPIMDLLESKGFGVWYHDGKCYVQK